ncbi:MAG: radical SAM protein [Candidatus Omnitrophota bacterium]|nr:MAG: radical SAM protein [Candidatus Omnitrophota bacterium]
MQLIREFDPWKGELCTCPEKYSLSPYTGCGHRCIYCYASSYIRDFYNPRPKNNFLKRIAREIKKIKETSYITISNSSDPYQPMEKNLELTRKTLEILKEYPFKIMIVTKSNLILRDIDILKEFKNLVISITLTTLDEEISEKIEPFAPLPCERLKAIEILSKYFPVVCRVDPLIYPLNTGKIGEIIKELKKRGVKQIITSTFKARPDSFKRMVKIFPQYKELWERLYIVEGERKRGYFYLPENFRRKLIEEVYRITLEEKMDFSSCREGFSELNTKNCDGSSFFKV